MACWRLLFTLLVPCAFAEHADSLSIKRLTAEAALVVHGTVASKTIQRDSAGLIITEVAVKVLEVWKGEFKEPTLPVVHTGGILGDQGARVSGQAKYAPGEEVILFLVPSKEGKFATVGMASGKFNVSLDPSGSRIAAQSNTTEALPISELKQQVQPVHE